MPDEKNSYLLKTIQDYGKGLLSFIRRRVNNDEDAHDILQDIWYKLSLMVNTSPVEQTSAWLYRVARNTITDKYRKHSESLLDDIFSDDDDEPDYSSILFWMKPGLPACPVIQMWAKIIRIPYVR